MLPKRFTAVGPCHGGADHNCCWNCHRCPEHCKCPIAKLETILQDVVNNIRGAILLGKKEYGSVSATDVLDGLEEFNGSDRLEKIARLVYPEAFEAEKVEVEIAETVAAVRRACK